MKGGERGGGIVDPELNLLINYVLSLQRKKGGRKGREKKSRRIKTPQDKRGQEEKRKTQH